MSVKAKNIQAVIPIDKRYTPDERTAIAFELIKEIAKRTSKGLNYEGDKFPDYVKNMVKNGKKVSGYAESLDFKNAGKSERNVNLQLSGDMLAALKLLDSERGRIKIGYDTGDSEAGRAEGNQIGSYGQSSGNKKKARPFIGFKGAELERIKKFIKEKFPLDDDETRQEATEDSLIAGGISSDFFGEDDG